MKPFKFGIIIGRFQIFHKGHQKLVDYGLSLCDKLVIYIGSSQESNTEKNPFSYEFRKQVIETLYGDKVIIKPLPDAGLGNNSKWGEYILNTIKNDFGECPDLAISGEEERRESWFKDLGVNISELIISKNQLPISSSQIKDWLVQGNLHRCMDNIDSHLWVYLVKMKTQYLKVLNNSLTNSI